MFPFEEALQAFHSFAIEMGGLLESVRNFC